MAVDEDLVGMLAQSGFEQIQQPRIGLHIRFVNDGNQPGLDSRPSLAEWRRDFSRWSICRPLSLRKRFAHFLGGMVTLRQVVSARFEEDFIELEVSRFDFTSAQVRGQLRKVFRTFAGADNVEGTPQAKNVGAGLARTFRRVIAGCVNQGDLIADFGHQPDVGQFRSASGKNDVGRLDVAMDEAIPMQMFQRVRQGETQPDAFIEGKPAAPGNFAAQRPGLVLVGID